MANYPNARSYSLLLEALSSDEESAAIAFSKLRDSLVRFFQLKGDSDPAHAADETLDRVSAKLGDAVMIHDLTKYSFGVARLVFLENLRKSQKAEIALKDYRPQNTMPDANDETDSFEHMRECFDQLPSTNRDLMRIYFADLPRAELDEERRRLATTMNASQNNLRLKIFRLRRRLEDCVRGKRYPG